jgi:hypothetical protein
MHFPYPLESFWPYSMNTDQGWKPESVCQIGPFDPQRGGFTLQTDSDTLLLPTGYKNGLRLMNAKISFLKCCATIFSEPHTLNSPQSSRSAQMLRFAQDSVMRNLQFTITVRDVFISEIKERSRATTISNRFRSRSMDAWLYCEFHCGRHDPTYVKEDIGECSWRLGDNGKLLSSENH